MRIYPPSRLRVLLVTLIVSATLVLGQARRAEAEDATVILVLAGAAIIVTVLTVVGVVCMPVAAVEASDYPGGFSAAFGDCFKGDLKDSTKSSAEESPSDKPSEADEGDEEEPRRDD